MGFPHSYFFFWAPTGALAPALGSQTRSRSFGNFLAQGVGFGLVVWRGAWRCGVLSARFLDFGLGVYLWECCGVAGASWRSVLIYAFGFAF